MRRRLGGFESAQAWTAASFPYNAVAVLRLAGRVGEAELAAALAAVQRRHPLLRTRLTLERGRWWFESAAGEVPLRRVERRGEEHWRRVAEEELGCGFPPATAPLVRCTLIAPPDCDGPFEIVLTFLHAVADATSGATVCRELLTWLAGAGLPAAASELPPPPEARFPARFRGAALAPRLAAFLSRQLAGEAAYLGRSRGRRNPVPTGPWRCRVLPVALGREATAALVRRARRERVPLNGALNAALLLAVQRHRYGGRPVPLRWFAFPDLRPWLEPPAGPEMVASYLTTMRFTSRLGAAEELWELARRLSGQLHGALARGERYLFCVASPYLLRAVLGLGRVRFGSAAVSYTGPLRFPAAFGGLEVRGLNAFVSNMPVGAEVTAQARLFRGRLWWDLVTLEPDLDEAGAAAVADDILARLAAAVDA